MTQDVRHHEGVEHHDYDAVCEACDEVNPPGTLLCKTCGNNLRDQQQRRFAEQGMPQLEDESILRRPRRVLAALLSVMGLVLIIWVSLNVDDIADWLTEAQMTAASGEMLVNVERYWAGETGAVFDDMVHALDRKPITAEEVAAADGAQDGTINTGRYYIKDGNFAEASVIGSAYVFLDQEEVYFVAQIPPAYEVRGIGGYDESGNLRAQNVGIRYRDQYERADGQATVSEDGSIFCLGEAGADSIIFQGYAYYVP